MRRALLTATALTVLALPAGASAKVVELGSKIPRASVSCPTNCQALTRVTGYQLRGGDVKNPFVIPRAGQVVAFTVRLGNPDATQDAFFRTQLNLGEPRVRLSILRKGKRKKTKRDHRLLAQSPEFGVARYFGSAPTFVLSKPLRVARGNIVALTTPTWAPALAVGLGRSDSWNSSRALKRCDNVRQNAQQTKLMTVKVFGCSYSTARVYYTATYIPDNRETKPAS